MANAELLSYYTARKTQFSDRLVPVRKKIAWISHSRLITAAVILLLVYFGFSNDKLLWFIPLLLLCFVVLVRYHGILFSQKHHLENLVAVNDRELNILRRQFDDLDDGSAFLDPRHPYAHDLDVFGKGSLYQYLNRCNTLSGKQRLVSCLTQPPSSGEMVRQRTETITELKAETELRQEIQAAGIQMRENATDRKELIQWMKQSSFVYGESFYRWALYVIPAVTLSLVVLAFISSTFRPFAFLMIAVQWTMVGIHMKRVNAFHDYIGRKKMVLEKYAVLLRQLQRDFSTPILKALAKDAHRADAKIAQLASLVYGFDARLNSMTFLFANTLLLWDLQCVYRLEKWRTENAPCFERWTDAVSEAEALCSFATYAFNHPDFANPEIHEDFSICAEELGHPLIATDACVTNSVSIGEHYRVMIVTGANMAGKSTFLRTLGINLVLALNGAPVYAKKFKCPVIHLRTGMRTADSLKDHQSYFHAELNRLSGIMNDLRQDIPLLILLDEILKGTNSTDKQAGSMALVKQLLPQRCLAVIATHDLVLGTLEREYPNDIRNFCFEASIANDQLTFDYKMKPGIATTMNATFLMKKMGIIPS